MDHIEGMVGSSVRRKPSFLSFIFILVGLYVLTLWAGLLLLRPLAPYLPASQSGSLQWIDPPGVNATTEWWQYLLFGLYNLAVWVGAYFIAARILPKFFS